MQDGVRKVIALDERDAIGVICKYARGQQALLRCLPVRWREEVASPSPTGSSTRGLLSTAIPKPFAVP